MMKIPELKKTVQGILLENESMSKHTSYGIGGKVMAYITPHGVKDLIEIITVSYTHLTLPTICSV